MAWNPWEIKKVVEMNVEPTKLRDEALEKAMRYFLGQIALVNPEDIVKAADKFYRYIADGEVGEEMMIVAEAIEKCSTSKGSPKRLRLRNSDDIPIAEIIASLLERGWIPTGQSYHGARLTHYNFEKVNDPL